MDIDDTSIKSWIGKSESRQDILTKQPMVLMAATLDRASNNFCSGDVIPPLWHWLYFLESTLQSKLAEDGHAQKGDFLPPISLPRRMWAGSRIDFIDELRIDQVATRESTIEDVSFKQGRSGQLAFVRVQHCISNANGLALKEQHDIVYRENPQPGAIPSPPQPAPGPAAFSKTVNPDPVLLFRYSALTFNGHRIHYDRGFAIDTESYPGLVVHGPLLATLMVDLFMQSHPACQLQHFEFKALHPVFDLHPFTVCCDSPDADGMAKLWIQDHTGALCMNGLVLIKK